MRPFLAFGLVFFVAVPALAAEMEPSIRPVFEPNGSFAFCLGEQSYADGRKLTVALSPKEEINLGVTILGAGFKREARYDVALIVGEGKPRKIRTQALDETTLLLQMGGNATFQKNLLSAKDITIGAGPKTVLFPLPPMDRFLGTLKKCLAEYKDQTLSGQQAEPPPTELPAKIIDFLKSAGLASIVPLPLNDVPEDKRPADYVWQTGKILGGIRERHAPEGQKLFDLIGLHMKGLEKECAGKFKASVEREQKGPGVVMRLAEASCAPDDSAKGPPVTVAMVLYLTDNGLFTVFTHEGAGADKAEALTARNKVAKALMDLAKASAGQKP